MKKKVDSLIYKKVNFSYDGEHWVFPENISVKFDRGNLNVVTGENGSGKSTLLNLALRIWENYLGNIYLEKEDIKTFDKIYLRDMVAYSFQVPMVIQDTITDNIALGKEVNLQKIEYLLKQLRLWNDIIEMPDRLQTIIDRDSLSQGQLQKIGIARVLYTESPVIIFDEPTSNLDAESVTAFIDFIQELKEKFLIVLISHDDKIVAQADYRFFF